MRVGVDIGIVAAPGHGISQLSFPLQQAQDLSINSRLAQIYVFERHVIPTHWARPNVRLFKRVKLPSAAKHASLTRVFVAIYSERQYALVTGESDKPSSVATTSVVDSVISKENFSSKSMDVAGKIQHYNVGRAGFRI